MTDFIDGTIENLLKGKQLLGHDNGTKRKVVIHKMTPNPQSKQLAITGQAMGTSLYAITLIINGIEYSDTKSTNFPLTVSIASGKTLFCEQASLKSKIQCRCSCPDFYYTWSHWNKKNKALAGPAMKPYQRKTTTYPERNPEHTPGFCKHLIALIERLKRDRIIK